MSEPEQKWVYLSYLIDGDQERVSVRGVYKAKTEAESLSPLESETARNIVACLYG